MNLKAKYLLQTSTKSKKKVIVPLKKEVNDSLIDILHTNHNC
jgi:hypothetical protein